MSIWVCRISATQCGAAINSHRSHIPDLASSCKPSLSSDHASTCIDLSCSRMNVSRGVTPETNPWSTQRLPWEWEKRDVLVAFAGQLHKRSTWDFPGLCGLHELFSSMLTSAFQCRIALGAMASADLRYSQQAARSSHVHWWNLDALFWMLCFPFGCRACGSQCTIEAA